jgi:hypothetical protein
MEIQRYRTGYDGEMIPDIEGEYGIYAGYLAALKQTEGGGR